MIRRLLQSTKVRKQRAQTQIKLDEKLNQAGKRYYKERACRQM